MRECGSAKQKADGRIGRDASLIIVEIVAPKRVFVFEQVMTNIGQNYTTMKTTNLVTAIALSAGLTFGAAAQAKERHEEETVS